MVGEGNVVGITVGHDGSIYLYGKPDRIITEQDDRVATMSLPWYSDDVKENQVMVLEALSKERHFEFRKL